MRTKTPSRTRRAIRATFSEELRDAIERSGLTAYALGKEAEVDPGILSRFLAGRRGMTTDTVDRIAAALGLHFGAPTRGRGRPRREPLPPPTDHTVEPVVSEIPESSVTTGESDV